MPSLLAFCGTNLGVKAGPVKAFYEIDPCSGILKELTLLFESEKWLAI